MKGLCYLYFHCILVVIIDHTFFFFLPMSLSPGSILFFHIKMKVVARLKVPSKATSKHSQRGSNSGS